MIEKDHALWSDKDNRNHFETSRRPFGRGLRYGERRYTSPDQSEIAKVKRRVTAIPKDVLDADLEAKANKLRVACGRTINMKDPCGYEVSPLLALGKTSQKHLLFHPPLHAIWATFSLFKKCQNQYGQLFQFCFRPNDYIS